MKKIFIISAIIATAFLLTFCGNSGKKDRKNPGGNELKQHSYSFENPPKFRKDSKLVFLDGETEEVIFEIDTEVVSNDMERALGLMYRPYMEENHGMLFLMDKEEYQSFYMRNTVISLDIIYVNSKFEIVDIYHKTKVLDDTSLPSAAPAKYVVEINAGLCQKLGIKEGDIVRF